MGYIFYITVILVVTIIILLTARWEEISELVKLITFGLTLTSLFLSLVAIIFSIFSNFSFTKSAANLYGALKKEEGDGSPCPIPYQHNRL